jgi:hypothetical protein
MKREHYLNRLQTMLLAVGIAGFVAGADAQDSSVIYCARMQSTSTRNWDAPFWWIPGSGDSPYSTSTGKSLAAGTPASRLGSYSHTSVLLPGEGFGVVCSACTGGPGTVYQVDVTQPSYPPTAADVIFGVCSTNCELGGLSGGGGSATNTTAFQGNYSVDKWGLVCYLTNTLGVPNPEIEFRYVSGGVTQTRQFADCVRFTQLPASSGRTSVRISSFSGTSLEYSGGAGTHFVLLKCTALCNWERVATNSATPGSFPIAGIGTEDAAFYAIVSE